MGWSWAIIIGIIGCGSGLYLPKFANLIIVYKQKQRNQQSETLSQDHRITKMGSSLLNGLSCGIYTYYADSLVMICFVAIIISIAIIFALIDWRIRIIPNEMVLITIGLGLFYQLFGYGLKSLGLALLCMIGLLVAFIIVGLIAGLDKIGAGDVKLVATMGLILGFPDIFAGLLVMSIGLIVYVFLGMLAKKLTHVSMFPFAPFMMLGMIFGLIYGIIN